MNANVGRARIGQWYLRRDKGEIFQVIGLDSPASAIELQTFDGDVDEIDADGWAMLPLELAEPPEDWTGPVDAVEVDDLGYSETDMSNQDWEASLQPLSVTQEAWENLSDGEDLDPEGDAVPAEELALDVPAARELAR